jgi:hypothetical protein
MMINMPLFLDTAHDNLNMDFFFVMENLITRWNVEKKVNLNIYNLSLSGLEKWMILWDNRSSKKSTW